MKRALALLALFVSCASTHHDVDPNPPDPGFDAAHSDPRAIAIANEVVLALGGRPAWDAVRVITWRTGKRLHAWDKSTGDYRLDDGGAVVAMNVKNGQGRVFLDGHEQWDEDARRRELDRAYSIWARESSALALPFELKAAGVVLEWRGAEMDDRGRITDVLGLRYEEVGEHPDGRYELLVLRETRLVARTRWFEHQSDRTPATTSDWSGWERHGGVLFSTKRSAGDAPSDVDVESAPPAWLTDPSLARPVVAAHSTS